MTGRLHALLMAVRILNPHLDASIGTGHAPGMAWQLRWELICGEIHSRLVWFRGDFALFWLVGHDACGIILPMADHSAAE